MARALAASCIQGCRQSSNSQDLLDQDLEAASGRWSCPGRSMSFPVMKIAPARTRATRWGAPAPGRPPPVSAACLQAGPSAQGGRSSQISAAATSPPPRNDQCCSQACPRSCTGPSLFRPGPSTAQSQSMPTRLNIPLPVQLACADHQTSPQQDPTWRDLNRCTGHLLQTT